MNEKSSNALYAEYQQLMQKVADVKYAAAVLQWDQETYLPPNGADFRARQLATLSELGHEMFVDNKMGELLQRLQDCQLSDTQARNVALTWEDYSRLKKLTPEFVRKMSEAVSVSFHAWMEARKQNDYKLFEPKLAPLVELKRQEADLYGYAHHPYEALMNEYEKGATVSMIDGVFHGLQQPLGNLLAEIQNKQDVDERFLHQHFPKQQQWEWGLHLAKQLGFDFSSGRQDISEHPFTTNFSSQDVRITTRIDENDFANMCWSTIHEVGHGLYEQGLPASQYGLPLGEYASLSIHESQSRLWENCVGRGSDFWNYYYPVLQTYFPAQFAEVTKDNFLKAINKVQPSLIRTEADELTYHFHVMIRYEMEKSLIDGSLQVHEIPLYWNNQYKKLLGVDVPNDKVGCLQDVHWSHGSFGYFPTYSLGSLYAAQFWNQAKKVVPGIEESISNQGNVSPLLGWLRENIHAHGRYYNSNDLCVRITGNPLDSAVFVNYLADKLQNLYPNNN